MLTHELREHLTDVGIHVFSADVTSDDDINKLREIISDLTDDTLDILINNA